MKIIVKSIFGSHLYGTNTETSDIDYKIVYQDTVEDIVLKKSHDNARMRTDDKSEEAEYIELRKFIKDLCDGQTYAVDMIFTPQSKILQKSEIWDNIVTNRRQFLTKDSKSFIGYAMNQAKIYTEKGERIRMMEGVLKELEAFKDYEEIEGRLSLPIVEKDTVRNGVTVTDKYYEINGKYYPLNTIVKEMRQRINAGLEKFGERSKIAGQQIKDWKSISHAYRVIRELSELALTGRINFPLKSADELLQIKQGVWPDYKEERIFWELNAAVANVNSSSQLKDSVDKEWVENFILKCYGLLT